MKQIFKRKGSGIGTQGSENKGVGSVGIGFEPVPAGNFIDLAGFKKGISIGLGIILTLATSAILAVAVTGTINTFSSGNVVDASQINTNFASLKTAIEGITSSQWTSSGSNIYYNAGNVGIGTSSPGNILHIKNGTDANLRFFNGTSINANGGMAMTSVDDVNSANKPLSFAGSSFYFHTGSVGIGTTTPGGLAKLHVSNGELWTQNTDPTLRLLGNNSNQFLLQSVDSNRRFRIYDQYNGFERITLDTAGNFGIGTASLADKLEVVGDIKVGTSGSNGCLKNFGGGTITGTCSSDEKLKKDIRPMESVLDKVSQLVPKTYHWRSEEYPNKKFGTQKEYGLVAQDVEKIFPDMVENDSNGLKAIHYERLPILTVQAVKELSLRLRGATEDLDREKLENAKLKQKLLSVEERLNVLERMVKK